MPYNVSSEIDHSYIVDFMLTLSLRHDFFAKTLCKECSIDQRPPLV